MQARFSAPVQTGPGAHSASCTMGSGPFHRGKERPGSDPDSSPPSSAVVKKEEGYNSRTPVGRTALHSLSACTRVQFTYLLTYLLSPRCRVLLEKLTGLQLVKKFPAFHGTRKFITALTSVRHLSLSWATPIQSLYPHPTSWSSILILSTHLRPGLLSGLLPSGFPTSTLYSPSPHPYAPHAKPISFSSILSPAQY